MLQKYRKLQILSSVHTQQNVAGYFIPKSFMQNFGIGLNLVRCEQALSNLWLNVKSTVELLRFFKVRLHGPSTSPLQLECSEFITEIFSLFLFPPFFFTFLVLLLLLLLNHAFSC